MNLKRTENISISVVSITFQLSNLFSASVSFILRADDTSRSRPVMTCLCFVVIYCDYPSRDILFLCIRRWWDRCPLHRNIISPPVCLRFC